MKHTEVRPESLLSTHNIRVRDRSVLSHGRDLSSAGQSLQLVPLQSVGVVGEGSRVSVNGHHVDSGVSGVPSGVNTTRVVVNPDSVVDTSLGKLRADQVPHGNVRSRALCTPPEPSTSGLVERPPEDGDTGGGQQLELADDDGNVFDGDGVFGGSGGDGLGDVVGGVLGVEGVSTDTGVPVPLVGDDTALVVPCDGAGNVVVLELAVSGVEDEIEETDGGGLAGLGLDEGEF